jgi:hypothetical protein
LLPSARLAATQTVTYGTDCKASGCPDWAMDSTVMTKPGRVAAALGAGALVAAGIAAAFLALTAVREGVTFHLFPLAIAGGPAVVARMVLGAPLRLAGTLAAAAIGLLMMFATWLAVVAWIDPTPTVTFVEGQPGGVPGEFAALATIGALAGAWWARR